MKSDSNTEMELLLRRYARRSRSTLAPEAGSESAHESNQTTTSSDSGGTHMDADEMNAYAEGALPAPARARYMAHLADCDRCRRNVTNLTLAANVPLQDPEGEAQQPTSPKRSWREWMAALLSPPVIRYGVPALVLLCVVGVVFLVMRQREEEQRRSDEPTLVARNNDQRAAPDSSAVKPDAEQSPATTLASPTLPAGQSAPAQPRDGETAQSAVAPVDKESLAKNKQTDEQQTPAEGAALKDAPAANTVNETSRQETAAAARNQRDEDLAAAQQTRPAAAPPPTVSSAEPKAAGRAPGTTESDSLSRRKDDSASDNRAGALGGTRNTASREAEERPTTATKSAPAAVARRRVAGKVQTITEGADASGGAGAGERASATRAVGGRQFKRQGNAWVDTAYTQGRATVNVSRGSEQYRALTADEPGLRAIAEQLGGEVIVVWKGRAYRIH